MTLKILNLYAGIGGNRKLWGGDIMVTAVEIDPKIAEIYKTFFPNDKVIISDAHQYLLDHFHEFDFIWSSPPCPSHSVMGYLAMKVKQKQITDPEYENKSRYKDFEFPNMSLYQEIIFLTHFFKGKWVVENTKSYYEPLIKPYIVGSHYYWSNFPLINVSKIDDRGRGMGKDENLKDLYKLKGFDLTSFKGIDKMKTIRNCVESEHALHIFNLAFKSKQGVLKI